MGIIYDILDKVIPRVQAREKLEGGHWNDLLAEELKKIGCNLTDQSKGNNHTKQINDIISSAEELNNDK